MRKRKEPKPKTKKAKEKPIDSTLPEEEIMSEDEFHKLFFTPEAYELWKKGDRRCWDMPFPGQEPK